MATKILESDAHLDEYVGSLGGISRRDFMKFCAGITATMGLPASVSWQIAEAATNPNVHRSSGCPRRNVPVVRSPCYVPLIPPSSS